MHSAFNAQSSESSALRKKSNDQHMLAIPGLASDEFNIWWQKTAAQNLAMITEASDLMRAHQLINSARQSGTRRAY